MTFARLLREVIEEDNGLILRVTAYEKMVGQRERSRGWSERFIDALAKRSRKIFSFQSADGALYKISSETLLVTLLKLARRLWGGQSAPIAAKGAPLIL